MALTVEDGSIVSGANAYIDEAFADSYFNDRGESTWAGASSPDKEAAIILATDYIETRWGDRFKGQLKDKDQELSFPREKLYDNEGRELDGLIPKQLKRATAEYALRALNSALQPDPTISEDGRQVKSISEKVGPIEETTEYVGGGAMVLKRPYPKADAMLKDLVYYGGVIRN